MLEGVSAGYSKVDVLKDVSLSVEEGSAVGILGANGAGKTTLMRVIAGQLRARSGSVTLAGEPLRGASPSSRVRKGISLVAEGHEIIGSLTVGENLALGAFRFWPRQSRRVIAETRDRVYSLFPILGEREGQLAALLSGGQQQMLAIGRAMMSRPRVILLDEPSLGLAPVIVDQIYAQLAALQQEEGLTLVVVEQSSERAAALCDRLYLLKLGEVVASGTRDEISTEVLHEAYFG